MGLHGQGGIGKSVLAAAVAREEEIRRCVTGARIVLLVDVIADQDRHAPPLGQ